MIIHPSLALNYLADINKPPRSNDDKIGLIDYGNGQLTDNSGLIKDSKRRRELICSLGYCSK